MSGGGSVQTVWFCCGEEGAQRLVWEEQLGCPSVRRSLSRHQRRHRSENSSKHHDRLNVAPDVDTNSEHWFNILLVSIWMDQSLRTTKDGEHYFTIQLHTSVVDAAIWSFSFTFRSKMSCVDPCLLTILLNKNSLNMNQTLPSLLKLLKKTKVSFFVAEFCINSPRFCNATTNCWSWKLYFWQYRSKTLIQGPKGS